MGESEPYEKSIELLAGRSVLIVDEDLRGAFTLEVLLKELGAEVLVALSGRQALEQVARRDPDVVLSEIEMGDISGFELARHIRAAHGNGKPLLIALTSLDKYNYEVRAREAGFDEFLTKPLSAVAIFVLLEDLQRMCCFGTEIELPER